MSRAQMYAVRIIIAERLGYESGCAEIIDLSQTTPFSDMDTSLVEGEAHHWLRRIKRDGRLREAETVYLELLKEYPMLGEFDSDT